MCVCVCVQVPPTAEERGFCDVVEVEEIGDTNVVVFRRGICYTKFLNEAHLVILETESAIVVVVGLFSS